MNKEIVEIKERGTKREIKKIFLQWDSWRKYIADGGTASWPRDEFESLIDVCEEDIEFLLSSLEKAEDELSKHFKSLHCDVCQNYLEPDGSCEACKLVERVKEAEEKVIEWQHKYCEVGEIIQGLRNEVFELKQKVKELDDINTKLSEALGVALEDFKKAQEAIIENEKFYKLVNDRAIKAEEKVKELELLLENESKHNANHMELWNDALDKIRELEKELFEENEAHNKLEHDLQTNLTLLKDGVREHKKSRELRPKWHQTRADEKLYSILDGIEKGKQDETK